MINVSNLCVSYNGQAVFKDVSFKLEQGKKMVIAGKSGCGKTTMLHALLGFVGYCRGSVSINGKPLTKNNISFIREITSYMPQENAFPNVSVKSLLFDPLHWNKNKTIDHSNQMVYQYLQRLKLPENILDKELNEISGGQKQRLLLISILLLNKKILILDEPTSSLDEEISNEIRKYLIHELDKTIIISTHDNSRKKYVDKILELN